MGMLTLLACAGCAKASPTSPTSAPTLTTGSPSSVAFSLPIAAGDSANVAYGIWPFGVHGSSHALDGHPGFDFEVRPGSPILAAADGVVDSVASDPAPGRRNVGLRHAASGGDYFSFYSNLEVSSAMVVGLRVTRGQPIGIAGTLGLGASAFAMTHFQVGDPAVRDIPSPATYFTPAARLELDEIWQRSAYVNEWCEPFLTNSRAATFPMTRVYTLRSGDLPARLVIGCPSDAPDFTYSFFTADGTLVESGKLVSNWSARPTTAAFIASVATRQAAWDIVDGTLRLALAARGVVSPPSLAGASVYETR